MSNHSNDLSIAIMALENVMRRYELTPHETFTMVETIKILKERSSNGEPT